MFKVIRVSIVRAILCLSLVGLVTAPIPAAAAAAGEPPATWDSGTGSALAGKTHVERAIGKCVGSLIGGLLLGALVGAAAGSAKTGALVGAGVGIGACAIFMKTASKKDKIMLRQAQLDAANAGSMQTIAWSGEEGAALSAVVSPSLPVPLVVGSKGAYKCRTDNRCLVGDEWVPYQSLLESTGPKLQTVSLNPKVLKCRRLDTQMVIDGENAPPGSDTVCLVNDSWVTGDKLKKLKVADDNVVIA